MKQYLRPYQIDELSEEKRRLEHSLTRPDIQDRPSVSTQLRRVTKQLDENAPPDVNGKKKDEVAKRIKDLESEIQVGMLSHEEMRKSPHGAVGRHIAWERANKHKIMEWKNLQLMLNRGNPDQDVANIDRIRPTVSTMGMHDVLIPGQSFSFPSEQYKQNYDEAFKPNVEDVDPLFSDEEKQERSSTTRRR